MAEGNRNFVDQIYVTDGESSNNGQIIDIGAKAENVYFNDNVTLPNKLAEIANNSALTSKSQINITTDKVTSIVLNDSSDYNIVNLICDKKDNNNQVAFYRKNLFDFSVCDININDLATVNSVNRDNCTINFTTNETGINSGIYFRHIDLNSVNKGYGIDYTKLNSKPVTLSFDAQSDIDCILRVQFTKTSYTSVNISSTKQRFYVTEVVDMSKLNKAICFYLDSVEATVTISNIQIEVNNTATDYEDCDYQKVTLTDANINSLHTYYPSTTVISDSDFILTYIADTKNYIDNNLDTKENASNKIDTINFPSTTYYPSSKAVWDYVTSKNSTLINGIENLKNNKVNITDFNTFKDTTNQAIASLKSNKLDKTDFNTYKTATDKAIADNTKSIKANTTAIDKCVTDIANNSALISKNQINVTTDKSTSVVLNDSSDCNIVDLICDSDNYNLSVYGKNLFNLKNTRIWVNDYVVSASLIVDNNSINFDITPGNYFCGVYIRYNETVKDNLLIDKSCVISLTVTVDKSCTFRLSDDSSNKSVSKALEPSTETQISLPIILNQSAKAITFYGVNITETTHIKLSNIMIELGSVATEYEEYKDMQSVTQDTDLSTIKTNYPNTTVISDSDFQLTYIADTKNYIDSKFNELATALIAHESEVN